ncbi:cytochrome c1 [Sphingomonas sp.]|uniref:cytochrome c1 n=1 Tax=Sphingomonas sp. TaxID=28214 RepID=UPI0025E9611E|nr:cytochrome c1 [Sphingomonas sp.]
MVRPIGILAGLGIVTAVLWSLLWGAVAYIQSPPMMSAEHYVQHNLQPKKDISFSFDGPFGTYDNRQLQRGFQVYKEVCSACHSMKLVAFRDLEQIGFSKPEVKAIAKGWAIETPTPNPDTGEVSTRKSLASDHFPLPFANDIAARAANNNAIPPDQSLIAKARDEGPHYIYRLITGYSAQPAELLKKYPDVKTPPGLHYNAYFPNLNLAMAPPLTADGQVSYSDGTKATVPQMAQDVSAFLMWAAEPKLSNRHRVGWAAFVFLLLFTGLTYMAYQSIWADKKHKSE